MPVKFRTPTLPRGALLRRAHRCGQDRDRPAPGESVEHLPFASLEKHVLRCIQRHLRPELLARFKRPFVFRPLTREVQAEITEQRLGDLVTWQRQQGRQLTYDPAVVRFLLQRGFSPRLGARPLLDTIHELVGNALANDPLEGGGGNGRLAIEGAQLRLVR